MGEFDASFIDFGYDVDTRLSLFEPKGTSEIDHSVKTIKQSAIPMFFKMTPNPFDGVVFTVIRRIISQLDGELGLISKLGNPVHKLGSSAMIFRAIILVEH